MKTYTVEIDGTAMGIERDIDGKFIIPSGWRGIGTALKPAWEPIVLARKPLSERTIAANVLTHGTGALNIDGCRVDATAETIIDDGRRTNTACHAGYQRPNSSMFNTGKAAVRNGPANVLGRWPANLVHDGSPEVLEAFRDESRARFFYHAKADAGDRAGSRHPTVKPIALMRWLVRMVTPPGGSVLDPFAGTGTTGAAGAEEGFGCVMVEAEGDYVEDARRRLGLDT